MRVVSQMPPRRGLGGRSAEQLIDRKIAGDYRVPTFDRPTTRGLEVIAEPLRPTGVFEVTRSRHAKPPSRLAWPPPLRGIVSLMRPRDGRYRR
jgi:hypothetical protein